MRRPPSGQLSISELVADIKPHGTVHFLSDWISFWEASRSKGNHLEFWTGSNYSVRQSVACQLVFSIDHTSVAGYRILNCGCMNVGVGVCARQLLSSRNDQYADLASKHVYTLTEASRPTANCVLCVFVLLTDLHFHFSLGSGRSPEGNLISD